MDGLSTGHDGTGMNQGSAADYLKGASNHLSSENLERLGKGPEVQSAAAAAALKPLRVRVITVRPGDTSKSLARSMTVEDFPLERFLVLNGLGANEPLAPGRRVKIISE